MQAPQPVAPPSPASHASLGWVPVTGLGIAIAVSGNFSGWNLGLQAGGWGGMMVAALVMAVFYLCLTQCVAELAAALPHATGLDAYARHGLGPGPGFVAGMAVAVALALCTGLGATFIEAYCQSVFGFGGWTVKLACLAVFIGMQLRGAREAVGMTMAGGFLAVIVLLVFVVAMAFCFDSRNLYSIAGGRPTLFPAGVQGAFACIPYALFMYLGVEQAASAAGDMTSPGKALPRALFVAVFIVILIAMAVLLFSAAGAGVARIAASPDPLYAAITGSGAYGTNTWVARMVGAGAIVSLLATMFSLTYASSKQIQALAKTGMLPAWLGRTNRKNAPANALIVVAILGFFGTQMDPNTILVSFIFNLNICSTLVLIAFLRLRRTAHHLSRPYLARFGRTAASIGLLLSVVILAACAASQPVMFGYVGLGYAALCLYFLVLRHRKPNLASFEGTCL